MNISEYELKNINFKANIDFCVKHNDWRRAYITKYYLYNNKVLGLVTLTTGQNAGIHDIAKLIEENRIRVNNYSNSLPDYIMELYSKSITLAHKNAITKKTKQIADEIDEITNYLNSRNVKTFLHFTPISNLDSILENGICSRSYCNSHNIKFQPTDENRLDRLNYMISLSISFPNYKMLYMKQHQLKQHFIIIEIDPSIITECGIGDRLFCDTNAAKTSYKKGMGPNLKHLKAMFSDENVRKNRDLPLCYTTDPQAEVLIRGPIPIKYFKKIYFQNHKDFSYYFEKYRSPLFDKDRKFFDYRKDYAYHQKKEIIMKEDKITWLEDLPF